MSILSTVAQNPAPIFGDISTCNLAGVSWVIPDMKWSDHPGESDNQGLGPDYVANLLDAIGESPCTNPGDGKTYWNSTAIFIVWDDWGGWYDHVNPSTAPGLGVNVKLPKLGLRLHLWFPRAVARSLGIHRHKKSGWYVQRLRLRQHHYPRRRSLSRTFTISAAFWRSPKTISGPNRLGQLTQSLPICRWPRPRLADRKEHSARGFLPPDSTAPLCADHCLSPSEFLHQQSSRPARAGRRRERGLSDLRSVSGTAVAALAIAVLLAGTAGAATKYKVLHAFTGGSDGGGVYGGVTLDAKGNVYGTTSGGGPMATARCLALEARDCKASWNEAVLHNFLRRCPALPDGALPSAGSSP